ncbi:MAG TPA: flavohemoglobin expression-modulating QEGLA motif protein [Polyangiaceae bacterium]|nr:flavohemoglobin expression-modulating QEGLA motif protein [Polyangiaceae bacterium]
MQEEPAPRDDGKSRPGAPWRSYKERLARLAQRLVDAQRPIRILNAVKWDTSVFEQFRDSRWRKMPRVDAEYYAKVPLGFDPDRTIEEMRAIDRQVRAELGEDLVGKIVSDTALQFVDAVEMLRARGTKRFHELSRRLYGTPKETFADDVTRVRDVALDLYDILTQLDEQVLGPRPVRDVSADRAVEILNERLRNYFTEDPVRVMIDDGIVADAAAGSDYIKVRQGAMFSDRDLKLLEVHEGWVHVATSLNGQKQPVAKWLAIGSPRVAASQEGLAALMEVLTLCSHPSRARRLNNRVLAVDKAEDGASFLDVFEWFRTEGYDEETCFWSTQRVFRGGVLDGGAPFTKDIVYTKGIVSSYNFLRSAIAAGRPDLIQWLFVGKAALEDLPVLCSRAHEGVVAPPRYVPEMFRDLNGLAIWLGVSTFWGRLKSHTIQAHYERLFDVTSAR